VTQQLLWEEYRQANPDGYRYFRFCELYQRWRRKQDVVLRQEHRAGEKLFVDWAGTTIPIYDRSGGPVQQAHLFVAVLGASSYTYAEATADEQLANWIGAHVPAFEFYQGVPKLVVPDNTKTGVTNPHVRGFGVLCAHFSRRRRDSIPPLSAHRICRPSSTRTRFRADLPIRAQMCAPPPLNSQARREGGHPSSLLREILRSGDRNQPKERH
jgi:hypothetical protein